MKIAEVRVSGCRCETVCLEPIPRGIVGAVVAVEYTDPAWDSLRKTVVFRGAATKDVLDAGSEIVIPAEVVSKAGGSLYMGVYGVDAGNNVAIPTIWTELGVIQGAATPSGDASTSPALPVWAQIQDMIGDLGALDTEAKSDLVAAINESLTKGGGEVSPAAVQKLVDNYLKANPPKAGADGKDGITPTIGENGNWYLGDTDTGKPSRGADGQGGSGGTDISLGLTSATVGQTVRIKAVDADGKPTAWEAAETGEKWEKIAEIIIPDGGEESNALTIDKDLNGQPFALLKARLCGKFPKYTGESTIPGFSFAMLNGKNAGNPAPAGYTSVWPKVSASVCMGAVYEVDVSGTQMVESVLRSASNGWGNSDVYGSPSSSYTAYFTDSLWAKPITSIGGTGMLIFPGCKFVLYGVRA